MSENAPEKPNQNASLSDADYANADRLEGRSLARRRDIYNREVELPKKLEAIKANIIRVAKEALAKMPSAPAHWIWTAMGTGGITPRPATPEEFEEILREMVGAG